MGEKPSPESPPKPANTTESVSYQDFPGAHPVLLGAADLRLAIGRIPGLALDRNGFAVLGARAFRATGGISPEKAKAAIYATTLLFRMMPLSAKYQMSGLSGAIGRRLTRIDNQQLAGRATRP